MIVTYDEHGGFFDHAAPLAMPAVTVAGQQIQTTGMRVPAFLISPWVQPGDVFSEPLDHFTSILQLVADRFAPGEDYSAQVKERQVNLSRLKTALATTVPGQQRPEFPTAVQNAVAAAASAPPPSTPTGSSPSDPANAQAFHNLTAKLAAEQPDKLESPGWAGVKDYVKSVPGGASP